jgi:hypothetical protein
MTKELTTTNTIIRRSGVFDEVDAKYGISEDERAKIEAAAAGAAGAEEGGDMDMDMGGGAPPISAPEPPSGGGEAEPLSESKKSKLLGMLGESENLGDLFNLEKAQQNIYEIENKLNDILND